MQSNFKPTFDFDAGNEQEINAPAQGVYGSNNMSSRVSGSNTTDVPMNSGNHNSVQGTGSSASSQGGYQGVHPVAAFFHVAFKLAAILTFVLGGVFSSNYVLIFIITILFCAADFWTTKNVSGRILVSLRWWSEVKEDGTTQWVFESSPDADSRVNSYDSWLFWFTLIAYSGTWLLFCIFNFMSITKLPIAVLGLILAGTNLLGYIKCSRNAKRRLTEFVVSHATQGTNVVQSVVSNMVASPSTQTKV